MEAARLTIELFDKWKDQLLILMKETVIHNFPDSDISDSYYSEKLSELKEYLKAKKAIVYLAVEDEKVVGWIWCYKIDRFYETKLHVAFFSVLPEWRGAGVGTMLMNYAEAAAKELAVSGIDLFVSALNENAVGFYKKHGFNAERLLLKKDLKNDD